MTADRRFQAAFGAGISGQPGRIHGQAHSMVRRPEIA
jgi:hypothetical protein